jgi:hypothetical protein
MGTRFFVRRAMGSCRSAILDGYTLGGSMGATIYIAIALWCGTPSPMYSTDANNQINQCRADMLQCIDDKSYKECFSSKAG